MKYNVRHKFIHSTIIEASNKELAEKIGFIQLDTIVKESELAELETIGFEEGFEIESITEVED